MKRKDVILAYAIFLVPRFLFLIMKKSKVDIYLSKTNIWFRLSNSLFFTRIIVKFFPWCLFFFVLLQCDLISSYLVDGDKDSAQTLKEKVPIEYTWPAYRQFYPKIPYISSTFGESRHDHFHNGLDLAGERKSIYPMAKAKLLYRYYQSDDPYVAERGPGNTIFLDHGNGWWSSYYHLFADRQEKLLREEEISVDEKIALMGNTGRSGGAHLHFLLLKDYGRKF